MYSRWPKYVSVAQRREKAKKKMEQLRKKGRNINPVEIAGNVIARSFWGKAWCSHLENFSDYSNRLPRGRTYARNGSVCHLEINKGQIKAMVYGSELYNIEIQISALSPKNWQAIRKKCVGGVGSLLELLQGKISGNVMKTVTDAKEGLFPQPQDIKLHCDCPDFATLCKHVAAVLYGVGARLDQSPELLFLLRNVNHLELIDAEIKIASGNIKKPQVSGDLSSIFGIELDENPVVLKKEREPKKVNLPSASTKNFALKRKASVKTKTVITPTIRPSPVINISRGLRASHIKKLRKEFSMTELEFSRLLGKPVASLRNWEAKKGVLKLRAPNFLVFDRVFKMSKQEAWHELELKLKLAN